MRLQRKEKKIWKGHRRRANNVLAEVIKQPAFLSHNLLQIVLSIAPLVVYGSRKLLQDFQTSELQPLQIYVKWPLVKETITEEETNLQMLFKPISCYACFHITV